METDKTTIWENIKRRAIYIQHNRLSPNLVTPCYKSFFNQMKDIETGGGELAIAITEELESIYKQIDEIKQRVEHLEKEEKK